MRCLCLFSILSPLLIDWSLLRHVTHARFAHTLEKPGSKFSILLPAVRMGSWELGDVDSSFCRFSLSILCPGSHFPCSFYICIIFRLNGCLFRFIGCPCCI